MPDEDFHPFNYAIDSVVFIYFTLLLMSGESYLKRCESPILIFEPHI